MNNVQKVSDITATDVAEYLKIPAPTEDVLSQMEVVLAIAKDTVLFQCNVLETEEDLDSRKCFIGAVFKECERFWYGDEAVDRDGGSKFLNNIYNMYKNRAYPSGQNKAENVKELIDA